MPHINKALRRPDPNIPPKYRITQDHIIDDQSVTITYYVYFSRDEYGLWKIDKY